MTTVTDSRESGKPEKPRRKRKIEDEEDEDENQNSGGGADEISNLKILFVVSAPYHTNQQLLLICTRNASDHQNMVSITEKVIREHACINLPPTYYQISKGRKDVQNVQRLYEWFRKTHSARFPLNRVQKIIKDFEQKSNRSLSDPYGPESLNQFVWRTHRPYAVFPSNNAVPEPVNDEEEEREDEEEGEREVQGQGQSYFPLDTALNFYSNVTEDIFGSIILKRQYKKSTTTTTTTLGLITPEHIEFIAPTQIVQQIVSEIMNHPSLVMDPIFNPLPPLVRYVIIHPATRFSPSFLDTISQRNLLVHKYNLRPPFQTSARDAALATFLLPSDDSISPVTALIEMPPSSGKTTTALSVAVELFNRQLIDGVFILGHTTPIVRMWRDALSLQLIENTNPHMRLHTDSSNGEDVRDSGGGDADGFLLSVGSGQFSFFIRTYQSMRLRPWSDQRFKKPSSKKPSVSLLPPMPNIYLAPETGSLSTLPMLGNHYARPPRLLLILDEVHHLPANTFYRIASDWTPPGIFAYVLGLSGTMRRADGKISALFALMNKPVYSLSAIEMDRKLKLLWIFNVKFPIEDNDGGGGENNDDDDDDDDDILKNAKLKRGRPLSITCTGDEGPEKNRIYKHPQRPRHHHHHHPPSHSSFPQLFNESMFGTNPFLSMQTQQEADPFSSMTNNSNTYRNNVHQGSPLRSRWVLAECIEKYLCGDTPKPTTSIIFNNGKTVTPAILSCQFPSPKPKHILIIFNTVLHLERVLDTYESYCCNPLNHYHPAHLFNISRIHVLIGKGCRTRKKLEERCEALNEMPRLAPYHKVDITLGMVQLIGEGYDDSSIDCVMLIEGKGYGELSQSAYRMRNPENGTLVYISSILLRGAKRVKAIDMHTLRTEVYASITETRETNISL